MAVLNRKRTLTLSLALNLFLLGAVTAGVVTRYTWPPPPSPAHGGPFLPSPRELRAVLSPGDREVLDDVFKAHRGEFRPMIDTLMESRRQAAAALQAEPFDPQALSAAFDAVDMRDQTVTKQAQAVMVELAGKLGPDGRKAIAGLLHTRP
jgi:uncharacterized membrane protein